jgi:hypothetical protein
VWVRMVSPLREGYEHEACMAGCSVRTMDLDHTQPAGAVGGQCLVVAERRDLDPVLTGNGEQCLVLAGTYIPVIYPERQDADGINVGPGLLAGTVGRFHILTSFWILQTPEGQVLSSMWARYSSLK